MSSLDSIVYMEHWMAGSISLVIGQLQSLGEALRFDTDGKRHSMMAAQSALISPISFVFLVFPLQSAIPCPGPGIPLPCLSVSLSAETETGTRCPFLSRVTAAE